MKEEIVKYCARTLFLMAWADAVEREECPACGAIDVKADTEHGPKFPGLTDAIRRGRGCPACGRQVPSAGSGEDWANVLDGVPTPPEAMAKASAIVESLGDPEAELVRWVEAKDWDIEPEFREVIDDDIERFGHCLAMQALGSGVGLSDDVPSDDLGIEPWGEGFAIVDYRTSYVDPSDPRKVVSYHADRAEALSALEAGRYTAPKVLSVEFGHWDFDGGSLLACSPGCPGIVLDGGGGIEACPKCAPGLQFLSERLGTLLGQAGKGAAALRLLGPGGGGMATEAKWAALSMRTQVASWEAGGDGPDPSDLEDWAALLDRLAEDLS